MLSSSDVHMYKYVYESDKKTLTFHDEIFSCVYIFYTTIRFKGERELT